MLNNELMLIKQQLRKHTKIDHAVGEAVKTAGEAVQLNRVAVEAELETHVTKETLDNDADKTIMTETAPVYEQVLL